MGSFEVHLSTPLPATETFARVLDFDAHTEITPLTTVHHTLPIRAGSDFVARTGVGCLGFDDTMEIDEYAPPTLSERGRCTIRKTGRWVLGGIDLEVTPTSAHTSVLHWRQDITVRGFSRLSDPLVTDVARIAYREVLNRLLTRA